MLLIGSASQAASSGADTGADAGLNCVILPDQQVEVSSPVAGVIEEVLVRRSERVARGQVLARLESSVEEATVALANVRAATDAEIRLRRVERSYDAQHRDRLHALHVRQATSAQSLEDAQRAAEAARLRIRLAEDRQREAVLERRRADAVLALKTIRSPLDGVIIKRHKAVGEYVEDQPIVRIARLDPLRVEVIAPLALFGAVHEGMQMGIRAEIDPERERVGTVTAVDAVADPGSGMFGVELALPNPGLELPAGIKCKGRLLAQVADTTALQPTPTPQVVMGDSTFATMEPFDHQPGATANSEVETGAAAPSAQVVARNSTFATIERSEHVTGATASSEVETGAAAPSAQVVARNSTLATIERSEHVTGATASSDVETDAAAPSAQVVGTDSTFATIEPFDHQPGATANSEVETGAAAPSAQVVVKDSTFATMVRSEHEGSAAATSDVVTTVAAFAVTAPAAAPPGACLAYEALDDEGRARALARAAERMGGRAAISEIHEIRPFGYLVLTAAERGPAAQRALATRLQQDGITDLSIIDRGAYAGRISLGAYNGPRSAERRRAALAELGFDTEVHERTRSHRLWRVEVRLPAEVEPASAHAALARGARGSLAQPDRCGPLRAAAR